MTKIKRRAAGLLVLILLFLCGFAVFLVHYFRDGQDWAAFSANQTVYQEGSLTTGAINDRFGNRLLTLSGDGFIYSSDSLVRISTLHAVGDPYGNIGTGAVTVFRSRLTGYDVLNGLYDTGDGGSVTLSISEELNEVAWNALAGRKGTVAICDCRTGELLCMVSSPSLDPENMPDSLDSSEYEGVYINRFLSSAYTPGSTYKLLTMAAAIDTVPDFLNHTYTCNGSIDIDGGTVTCMGNHGTITAEEALAYSCNCAFAQIALEVGSDTLQAYAEKCGLSGSFSIDGIQTADGCYDIADNDCDVAWSGIGQYHDLVCPAAMLRYVAAIANHGLAPELTLVKSDSPASKTKILDSDTADILADYMHNNVVVSYGESNYPGMTLHAKSGTAEVSDGLSPHAWFAGYAESGDYDLAFVVIVENGGYGSSTSGAIASEVLTSAFSLLDSEE